MNKAYVEFNIQSLNRKEVFNCFVNEMNNFK